MFHNLDMKLLLLISFFSSLAFADLQSEFFDILLKNQKQKSVEPPKVKKAIEIIEKNRGSKSEDTQILPANPFSLQVDASRSISHIHQLIYLKFKDKSFCRAQLETYQDQSLFNGLKVVCVKEGQSPITFSDTL
jgi:hypothetical protein